MNTTAFITHSLKNAALEVVARFFLGLALVALALAPLPSSAAVTDITQLRVERADDGVYLSALVEFELAAVVEDALLKGIPVFFVVEADIYRDRWYWTSSRVTSVARTLRLAYQPLTRRWRVNIVSGLISSSAGLRATLSQNYETLPDALSAIQRVARWKIAESADIESGAAYTLDLNFRLDLSQLPRPFQIGVAGQRDWSISAQLKEPLVLVPPLPSMSPPTEATP